MISLHEFCSKIAMPEEVTNKILDFYQKFDFSKIQIKLEKLQSPKTWDSGLEQLKSIFEADTDGIKILTAMLVSGLSTYEKYRDKGISEAVFYDTFACFSRFVKEHKVSYGRYGFDREFWTTRQLSMVLFRIGELEYELTTYNGEKVISLHIPSDSVMTMENCRSSYHKAVEFLAKYYPEHHYENFFCHSWLLSPSLKEVLDTDSRILQFQSAFTVFGFDKDAPDYKEWIFKNRNLPSIEEAPQDTSLQRRVKAYIIDGGSIGCASGYLNKEPFLS